MPSAAFFSFTLLAGSTLAIWNQGYESLDVVSGTGSVSKTVANVTGEFAVGASSKKKPRSLLVLKTARTGSTWLCEQMNQRGMHITQEALLNWDKECSSYSSNCDQYLTTVGRVSWITQSLVRPMPKTPYALAGCLYAAGEMKSKQGQQVAISVGTYDKDKMTACSEATECQPPYVHEACSDLRGCFNERINQPGCYNTEMAEPLITGISFNFLSSLGIPELDACLEKDTNCISKQSELLRGAKEAAESQGVEVVVLAQIRSNLFRWAISRVFHSRLVDHYQNPHVEFNDDFTKITILNAVKLLQSPTKKVEQLLQMATEVSKDTQFMLYEDIDRSIDNSIEAILKSFRHSGDATIGGVHEDVSHDQNVHDQHPGGIENYVENLEEVQDQIRTAYPCMYRMSQNSTAKDDTLILPLVETEGRIKIDLTRDCCIADRDTYIRTAADYIKQGLKCG
uniref:Uncharacterized protein n=1 Tax=Norrisiella sphaerica TaxID=552664 RepID=A0A7S2QT70_9EUKA|mmetsp:Transcript_2354/g.3386  ORF Transcript_2354/g.3386 Transcript_2354/m.3386 type:complete len:454 (+) Transcript_2354:51-1412(+)|eukprot:CAMPEP_0184482982 /NCGR_PEP_ID=MMETSP0113_2-20130426/4577_1 /TAXON_ID=91329 /ORGANISM="Norrisiella sphaerica, Strain BC52" /LENGTH=453 /DNA_ID=CAMNT_0026863059 /DNA_START=119 /DNA_END=1480 /DNA_ORIENTATION=-